MKKFLLVILSCLLIVSVVSFSACESDSENSSGNESSQSGGSSDGGEQGGGQGGEEDIQEQYSEGLEYKYFRFGESSYRCIGVGSCKDKDIKIPPVYNGLPVKSVYNTFKDCDFVESITIPRGVFEIQDDLSNCPKLKTVNIPCSAAMFSVNFGDNAYLVINSEVPESFFKRTGVPVNKFFGNAKVNFINNSIADDYNYIVDDNKIYLTGYNGSETDLIIPTELAGKEVAGIYPSCFALNSKIVSVKMPDTLRDLNEYVFAYCSSLARAEISNNVNSIGEGAFWNCTILKSIVIPDSVTSIGDYVFSDSGLKTVYYKGSVEDWDKIDIYYISNLEVQSADRYYFSESEPTETGKYWHYVDNKPTKW